MYQKRNFDDFHLRLFLSVCVLYFVELRHFYLVFFLQQQKMLKIETKSQCNPKLGKIWNCSNNCMDGVFFGNGNGQRVDKSTKYSFSFAVKRYNKRYRAESVRHCTLHTFILLLFLER